MFEEYEKIANKSIEDSIKSETHGSLEEAMLTVGKRWSSMLRYTCVSQPWSSVEGQHQRAKGPELNSKCWVPVLTINQDKPPHQPPLSACTIHPGHWSYWGRPGVLNVFCSAQDHSLCCPCSSQPCVCRCV